MHQTVQKYLHKTGINPFAVTLLLATGATSNTGADAAMNVVRKLHKPSDMWHRAAGLTK